MRKYAKHKNYHRFSDMRLAYKKKKKIMQIYLCKIIFCIYVHYV